MLDAITVGDVVIARFPLQNPRGREQEGIRPALIVGIPRKLGILRFPLIIVAPMTSDRGQIWANDFPALYPRLTKGEAGLPRDSIVLLDQIRSLDTSRIERYLGTLSIERYGEIFKNIQSIFDFDNLDRR